MEPTNDLPETTTPHPDMPGEPVTIDGVAYSPWEHARLLASGLPQGDWGQYRVARSGAICDRTSGKIVKNPREGNPFSLANPEMQKRAREAWNENRIRARLAAQEALGRFGIEAGAEGIAQGWARIVEGQAKMALDTSTGRTATDAARFVGSATGFTSQETAGTGDRGPSVALELSTEVLQALAQYLRDGARVTIDAQARDVGGNG